MSPFEFELLGVLKAILLAGQRTVRTAKGLQRTRCPLCHVEALWETEETFGVFKTVWRCDHCRYQEYRHHRPARGERR